MDDTALNTSAFGMTSVMGSSPRIVKKNSIIKNGVIFEGTSAHVKNSPFGPGHYFVETDTLNKKSFNTRAMSSKNHASASPASPANNGNSTPIRRGSSSGSLSRSNSGSLSRSNSNNSLHHSPSSRFSPQPTAYSQHSENNNSNMEYRSTNYQEPVNDSVYSPKSKGVKPSKVHTPISGAAYEKLLKAQQNFPLESVLKNRPQSEKLHVRDLTSR